MNELSIEQSAIISQFCDHHEPLFCNEDTIATEIYLGNLPEGTALSDIEAVMSDIKDVLIHNSSSIYNLRSIDDKQAAYPSVSFLIGRSICGCYVQVSVDVQNVGDPDDDDDKIFDFAVCYKTKEGI